MTTTQNDRIISYTAVGGETVYAYDFPLFFVDQTPPNQNPDLQVDLTRAGVVTTLIQGVDYTVQGTGNPGGGTITLTNPALAGDIYVLYGVREYRQVNYISNSPVRREDLNLDGDKITQITQQLRRDIDRSIRFPIQDYGMNSELPLAADRANKYPRFDNNGDLTVSDAIGVAGPNNSIDNEVALFDGTDGQKIKRPGTTGMIIPAGTTAERPLFPAFGMTRANTTTNDIEGYTDSWRSFLTGGPGGSGAPSDATYIVQTSHPDLSNEQVLSDLATGIVKNTTGTGVLSIAAEGVDYYAPGGTDIAITDGGTGASTAADARTNLGLAIGTNVQAYDATLQSLSNLGTAANKYAYTTGVDTWVEGDITAAGRALLDDADATAQRATLGLTIGTNVQAHDATLDALAAYNTNGIITQTAADTFVGRTITAGSAINVTNGSGVAGNPTVALDINSLTEDLTPDINNDFIVTYDTSEATNKKVKLPNFPVTPLTATYVTMSTNATLPNERVLTAGSGLSLTDGGAGGNATLAMDISGLPTPADTTSPIRISGLVAVHEASSNSVRRVFASDLGVACCWGTCSWNGTTVSNVTGRNVQTIVHSSTGAALITFLEPFPTNDYVMVLSTGTASTLLTPQVSARTTTTVTISLRNSSGNLTNPASPLTIYFALYIGQG